MMACLSGISALGIDAILPVFPNIVEEFGIPASQENRVQQVVLVFMLGLASLQIFFGILADVFGRKMVLLGGLALYCVASIAVFLAPDFECLLWARFFQGAGLSAPRVLALTIVRDRASGAAMSRIMSLITMVFLMIPVIAPFIGQITVAIAPWKSIFLFLLFSGLVLFAWVSVSLPETLSKDDRIPFSAKKLVIAVSTFSRCRTSQIYVLMLGLLFGMLISYVSLAELILQKDIYHLGAQFPFYFALIVTGMLLATFINAKFVMRWGMKKMLLIALCLLVFSDSILFLSVIFGGGAIPLAAFIGLLIIHFLGFGLAVPNINAMCLQPFKSIAGTASSLIGTIMNISGVLIAQCIGFFFNKTLYSVGIGFMLCTVFLCILYWLLRQRDQAIA